MQCNEQQNLPKPDVFRKVLLLVALHLDSSVGWDATSDILATKILGTALGDVLRGHPDGVYHYMNGAWNRIEEIPESLLRSMELVLVRARCLYKVLMTQKVERKWDHVFDMFRDPNFDRETKPACDCELQEALGCLRGEGH